jgi:hypothetical protein
MKHKIHLVTTKDAPFIVELRNNPQLNTHLSATSAAVADQVKWIEAYKEREKKGEEFYFVITENGERKGLYRLYRINPTSFTIGSWLFTKCSYQNLPLLTEILMDEVGFFVLNKKIMLFDTRKDNQRVLRYSAIKKPLHYTEDEKHHYFLLQREQWEEAKERLFRFFRLDAEYYAQFKAEFLKDFKK